MNEENNTKTETQKTQNRSDGGLWEKESIRNEGEIYYYGNIELEGKKHTFRAFPNHYYKEGQPHFRIILDKEKKIDFTQSRASKIVKKESHFSEKSKKSVQVVEENEESDAQLD